jgi:hypothetical protein
MIIHSYHLDLLPTSHVRSWIYTVTLPWLLRNWEFPQTQASEFKRGRWHRQGLQPEVPRTTSHFHHLDSDQTRVCGPSDFTGECRGKLEHLYLIRTKDGGTTFIVACH